MNNRRIGRIAVSAIVGILSAISGIASMELIQNVKKEALNRGASENIEKRENKSWGKKH
ncbi:MAG: hypothetical protein K6E53_05715 [Lachnospiraceae bacterium]|nr:hypothetical protein [Lachnospiraceae bacterium]